MKGETRSILVLTAALLMLVQGCATLKRRDAVPASLTTQAEIPGIPNARFWVDADLTPYLQEVERALDREKAFLARSGQRSALPPANFLAISGGGDNGAFGAGLLVGWTQTGTRPEFKGVTGISTGALIAPFAFLGPDYDDALKTVYTSITPKDIYTRRSFLAVITNDAMADTRPLWNLIKKYIDRDMLLKIAKEYEKGRLLFIGTTNLDSRRPVIWNMGAIAASNDPGAPDLFCSILLASAAIPGAFPPVMINVETHGQQHQEMHVDGGAVTQVFLYPPRLIDFARNRGLEIATRERKVYIIRNARLDPDWASVERRTLNIAGRAISSLIHSQGIGDLYRIYLQAQKDGLDYNLAYIPDDFDAPRTEDFDREYMNKLFEIGYQLGRAGYKWHKYPPYLKPQSKP